MLLPNILLSLLSISFGASASPIAQPKSELDPSLPSGTPPGLYMIQPPSAPGGKHNVTKIQSLPSNYAAIAAAAAAGTSSIRHRSVHRPAPRRAKLSKRETWGWTGNTFPDEDDYNFLTYFWRHYFAQGYAVGLRTAMIMAAGDARLAACNYADHADAVEPWAVDDFNNIADANWGCWETGWIHYDDSHDWTFWRDLAGTYFCTNL